MCQGREIPMGTPSYSEEKGIGGNKERIVERGDQEGAVSGV